LLNYPLFIANQKSNIFYSGTEHKLRMRVHIVEDEEVTANRLSKMLQNMDENLRITGITESVESTVAHLKINGMPDLIMMDIHLSDGSSFDIFKKIDIGCPVIFTTAYDQYAIKAFKVNSIDYLLKPIKRNELEDAFAKFRKLSEARPTIDYSQLASMLQSPKESASLNRMMVKVGQQIKSFNIEEVAYFYIDEKIVFVKLKSGDRYAIDFTLDQLEHQLDSKKFFRLNRSFIIGFDAIDKLYTFSKSRIKVLLKPVCEIESISSTDRSPLFRDWLS
jgi:DNA-binding LytR/AlgR family response regulator